MATASSSYYSSTKYFNNQKDALINQLRNEVYELKSKAREYDRLQSEVHALEKMFRDDFTVNVSSVS